MSRAMLGLGGIGLLLLGMGVFFFMFYTPDTADAGEIVAMCESEGERCYEREVPKLYPTRSIPEVFAAIREIRTKDSTYQFCHVLAHKMGEAVVAEDPAKWLDAFALNPSDNLCSNGFIHGIIVGRFRNDVLDDASLQATVPDFRKACEPRENWAPSPLDQAICYHGLGHLFTFITNADLMRALDVCDAIGESKTGNFMRVCREGVYMQIYQPLEPDDFELVAQLEIKPTKENYRQFCKTYSSRPEEEGACLREAWPMFRQGLLDGTEAARFCSGQPNSIEEASCYQSISAIVGRMSLGSQSKAVDACKKFPAARQVECFSTVAMTRLEEQQTNGEEAIALCNAAPATIKGECISILAQRASFIFSSGSAEKNRFCSLLPDNVRPICMGSASR